MTARERQIKRLQVAKDNGYVSTPVPETPEWAATKVSDPLDAQAAEAALALRGLLPMDIFRAQVREIAAALRNAA